MQRILLSENGDASYISTFVYILAVVILVAFIINVFHIISVKQEINHMANQLVKQIQLNGGTSGDTDSLFQFHAAQVSDMEGLAYQITNSGNTSRIQIGTPFYVTVTGCCHLGGFWKFNQIPINIRNTAKMELNNVSARIYADTFHSQREANLDSYMADLNLSTAYQAALRAGFIDGMEEWISLATDEYTISNINLAFHQYSGKMEYEMTCDVSFRIRMFGKFLPPIVQHITLTGSHNIKY